MEEQLLPGSIKLSNEILLGAVVEFINNGSDVKINISGNSMKPFLSDGDVVLLRNTSLEDTKLGDIVLGKYNGAYVLHRVIGKNRTSVFLAGDNNFNQIEVIEADNILAKAIFLVKDVGYVDLISGCARVKGLIWYYLRPFRKVYFKLFR